MECLHPVDNEIISPCVCGKGHIKKYIKMVYIDCFDCRRFYVLDSRKRIIKRPVKLTTGATFFFPSQKQAIVFTNVYGFELGFFNYKITKLSGTEFKVSIEGIKK